MTIACEELSRDYDVIVCGAGSSGSVVAARLSAHLDVRVLLLEAGPTDDAATVDDPPRWPENLGSERDWGFAAEPDPALNGRALPLSMGKGLGVNASAVQAAHRRHDHQIIYMEQTSDAMKTSHAVRLSSCLLGGGRGCRERGGFVVGLAGVEAVV
jgi:choline dehydrogenase-like flavoprotein